MNKKYLDLAADLLKKMSNDYSNQRWNFPDEWKEIDKHNFINDLNKWAGTKYSARYGCTPPAWLVMHFLSVYIGEK